MAYSSIGKITVGTAGTGTTGSLDTTGANLLIAAVGFYYNGSSTAPTLSDSKGNTWNLLSRIGDASVEPLVWYYAYNATVGTGHTFTLTRGSNFYGALVVQAFAGALTTDPIDGSVVSSAQSAATTHQPGSVTPSADNYLVATALVSDGNYPSSIDGSFVAISGADANGDYNVRRWHSGTCVSSGLTYWIQTTATASNPTWTMDASAFANLAQASFKVGGGSSFTPTPMLHILQMAGGIV